MVQKQASQIKRQQFIDVLNDCHLLNQIHGLIFLLEQEKILVFCKFQASKNQ